MQISSSSNPSTLQSVVNSKSGNQSEAPVAANGEDNMLTSKLSQSTAVEGGTSVGSSVTPRTTS